jgi:hypothetical protein
MVSPVQRACGRARRDSASVRALAQHNPSAYRNHGLASVRLPTLVSLAPVSNDDVGCWQAAWLSTACAPARGDCSATGIPLLAAAVQRQPRGSRRGRRMRLPLGFRIRLTRAVQTFASMSLLSRCFRRWRAMSHRTAARRRAVRKLFSFGASSVCLCLLVLGLMRVVLGAEARWRLYRVLFCWRQVVLDRRRRRRADELRSWVRERSRPC